MSLKYEVVLLHDYKVYRRYGECHRVNKPSKIWRQGCFYWCEYGVFHRIGGQAILLGYYIRGKRYTKKKYESKIRNN